MRLRLIHLSLVMGSAALSGGLLECGKIPCATDDTVCGTGGRCNDATGLCEEIPGADCDVASFGDAPAAPPLVLNDLLLTYDPLNSRGCIGRVGNPYNISFEVEFDGPLTIDFSGDELFFSAEGGAPVNCDAIQAFQVLNDGPCDGTETCFVRCATCFEGDPQSLGVQLREDDGSDAPLALAACVDIASGLVDSDCDALPDFDEGFLGTDANTDDSDGDGIPDGVELGAVFCGAERCNGSCPLDADPRTTTQPLDPDSDADSIGDGIEDVNRNGAVDVGETDPNEVDGE